MTIRELLPYDNEAVFKIWEKFYKNEFPFPDFYHRFICSFVMLDDDKNVITAGGVLPIAEIILVTDKDKSSRLKHQALYQVLDLSSFIARKFNYRQLHAFSQDDVWTKRMIKDGFQKCKGEALVLILDEQLKKLSEAENG